MNDNCFDEPPHLCIGCGGEQNGYDLQILNKCEDVYNLNALGGIITIVRAFSVERLAFRGKPLIANR